MYIVRVLQLPGARFLILGSPPATADLVVVPGATALSHCASLCTVEGEGSNKGGETQRKGEEDHIYQRMLCAGTTCNFMSLGLLLKTWVRKDDNNSNMRGRRMYRS